MNTRPVRSVQTVRPRGGLLSVSVGSRGLSTEFCLVDSVKAKSQPIPFPPFDSGPLAGMPALVNNRHLLAESYEPNQSMYRDVM